MINLMPDGETADSTPANKRYIWQGQHKLRCGYTTGSCAALAAGAATRMLLTGQVVGTARLVAPSGIPIEADVLDACIGRQAASCAVRKDAGDDIDATDGMLIYASANAGMPGQGVRIDGGQGIGRVTLPGLDQPVGAAAINSVPRKMITDVVVAICADYGVQTDIDIIIWAPQGQEIAKSTFNEHLGIVGGISILGTTGIVEPMSQQAMSKSICLEIDTLAAQGVRDLVIVPGNYAVDFCDANAALAHLPRVSCSNFLGDALDCASRNGFKHVVLVGHIGKLAKVALGAMQTHSRIVDGRLEAICAHAAMVGIDAVTARALMSCATTDAALDVLAEAGVLVPTMQSLTQAIAQQVGQRLTGTVSSGVIVFSKMRGELGRSPGTSELIDTMNRCVAAHEEDTR